MHNTNSWNGSVYIYALNKMCVLSSEENVSPSTGWSIHRPKAASCKLPAHAYYTNVLQVQCAQYCFSHGGCTNYKFQLTGGRYGNCQLLVPTSPAESISLPPDVDGEEANWKCFSASSQIM